MRTILITLLFVFSSSTALLADHRAEAEFYYLEGLKMKYAGEGTVAFELLRKAVETDSMLSGANYELSLFYAGINQQQAAVDALKRAVAVDPGNYWYSAMLGKLYEQYNLNSEATDVYLALRSRFPYKEDVILMLADLYTRIDSTQLAISAYDDLEKLRGASEEIALEKFKLFTRMNLVDSAFAEINNLIKEAPMNAHYLIVKGDLLLDAKKHTEAFDVYQQAKALEPDNAYLFISLSRYYETIGQEDEAKKAIESALVNDNLDVGMKVGILTSYMRNWYAKTGDLEPAYQLFETLLEQHPQEEQLFSLYATFLASQDRKEEATAHLEIAVAMSPTTFELWMQLIGLNLEMSRFAQAVEVCNQAMAYFADRAELLFYKGAAYFQEKDYLAALECYKKGVEMVPEGSVLLASDFYGQIGDVYQMLDQMDECYAAYEKALALNPKNIVVLNNYAYYLSLRKQDLRKAEKMSGRCIELEPQNSTYLDTYAWIYFMQGQYTLAKFYLEQAIGNGGSESDVVVEHYGDVLYKTGDVERALEQWNKALELGNSSETLRKKIETKQYVEEKNEK